jgi:uncharacterized protein YndB with AHSA1/START domain
VERLEIRRRVGASPARVFAAWTDPEELKAWWGPEGASCPAAEVDLRVGGAYRIANRFRDGRTVWIVGTFEVVEAPRKLVYTWRLEPGPGGIERVTVLFEPRGDETEIIVLHEGVEDVAQRDGHERGWLGCLGGLARRLEGREGEGEG